MPLPLLMRNTANEARAAPAWGSALGTMMVLFGILLAAWHANECMRLAVAGNPPFTIDSQPPPACEADELAEEGLSLAECRQMARSVHDLGLSSPAGFRPLYIALSATGALLASLSVVAGLALVDYRRWAPGAALAVIAALGLVDLATFIAVVGTGPLLRQAHLWSILLWACIHLSMAAAAVAGRQAERERIAWAPDAAVAQRG